MLHIVQDRYLSSLTAAYCYTVVVPRWGRGGGRPLQIPAPKFGRILDTLWSIDSKKN